MTKIFLVGILALISVLSAPAQQIRYFPDFTSVANLQMNGTVQATYNSQFVLRLTQGAAGPNGAHPEAATAWFTIPQPVNLGFTSYFRFQIHNAPNCCTPGDGLAFVVQNASSTDATYGAAGMGVTARGVSGGGNGYAGIPNSLAVEFDTVRDNWDPTSNHVAVQGCGTLTNGPVHIPGTFTIFHNTHVTSCLVNPAGINSSVPPLGVTCGPTSCADGLPHDVVIEYAPVSNIWRLRVWIDPVFITGTHTPVPTAVPAINIPYNIDHSVNSTNGISLAGGTSAWVGFTASQNAQSQQQDILAWEFTPHTPTTVTQTIQNGTIPTVFNFGGHDHVVTYYAGFVNTGNIQMTVTATPVPRPTFYRNRLTGTPFSNEQCVVYLGTGGNCIVYSITCQQGNQQITCPASLPNTCNNIGDPGCLVFSSSFYTADGITPTNADYLKADPIGTNNWITIFQMYQPSVFDGKTTGTGGTTSDFVATFKVGAQ
jgi:hypothetical protein